MTGDGGRNWLRPGWKLTGGQAGALTVGQWGTMEKKYQKQACEGRENNNRKKDGIKTNDEMEVTRGVVVGWTVWTRVDVEPNEAKV